MLNNIIALVGLSGVGKSTLIRKVSNEVHLQVLSASQLIKNQKKSYTEHDELRFHDINDNQRLLVDGFKLAIDRNKKITILDGHTVIETEHGLSEISADVFKDIGIQQFIFLAEEAHIILKRRSKDHTRKRSVVTLEVLDAYQMQAIGVTTRIALKLRVPVTILTSENTSTFKSILKC